MQPNFLEMISVTHDIENDYATFCLRIQAVFITAEDLKHLLEIGILLRFRLRIAGISEIRP